MIAILYSFYPTPHNKQLAFKLKACFSFQKDPNSIFTFFYFILIAIDFNLNFHFDSKIYIKTCYYILQVIIMSKHIQTTEQNKYPTQQIRRDPAMMHLYSAGEIRILTVDEYQKLEEAIPKDEHKIILKVLLITGMRFIELQRLYDNPEWYNQKRNHIHLPPEGQKKHKRTQKERTIHPLPSMFSDTMKLFFSGCRPPHESSWNRNIQRWSRIAGLNPYGISAKTTRKTIESWMVTAGIEVTSICLRQGHDSLTSMNHYQGLAFSDSEQRDIENQLKMWGLLK
jgi:integrase